jgi:hypothetical protein
MKSKPQLRLKATSGRSLFKATTLETRMYPKPLMLPPSVECLKAVGLNPFSWIVLAYPSSNELVVFFVAVTFCSKIFCRTKNGLVSLKNCCYSKPILLNSDKAIVVGRTVNVASFCLLFHLKEWNPVHHHLMPVKRRFLHKMIIYSFLCPP